MTEQEVKDKTLKKSNNVLDVLKETITLDQIRLPVLSRLKKRYKELEKLSRATHEKVPMALGAFNHFETKPPKIFLSGLEARFDGRTGAIVYMVYKTEKNKNSGKLQKVIKRQSINLPNVGDVEIEGHYIIDKVFIETIDQGKSIQRQEYNPRELGIEE